MHPSLENWRLLLGEFQSQEPLIINIETYQPFFSPKFATGNIMRSVSEAIEKNSLLLPFFS